MATNIAFHFFDNSTLANFKAWAQEISNFFTTAGWTQAADTGQVNWSTIVSVPASGSYVYEVWKTADALSSTFPIYLKIEYGTGATANAPAIRFSTCTATDGAGNPTTGFFGPQALNVGSSGQPSSPTTFYMRCRMSGDSGRMWFAMFEPSGSTFHAGHQMLSVARSVSSSGVRTNSYFTTWYGLGYLNGSTTPIFQYSTLNGGNNGGGVVLPVNTGVNAVMSSTNTGGQQFGTNGLFGSLVAPAFALVGYWDYPHPDFLVGPQLQYVNATVFPVTIYGAQHTYTAFAPDNANNNNLGTWWVTNSRFLSSNNFYSNCLFLFE